MTNPVKYGSNANDETSVLVMTQDEGSMPIVTPLEVPSSSSTKMRVAAGLIALGCAAATVAVAGSTMMAPTAPVAAPATMTLQSITDEVLTVTDWLNEVPVFLKSLSTTDLCVSNSGTSMTLRRCNTGPPAFVYRNADGLIHSVRTPEQCWSTTSATDLRLRLLPCNNADEKQQFVFDAQTSMIRLGSTMCVENTRGDINGYPSSFWIKPCDETLSAQKFALKPVVAAATSAPTLPPTQAPTPPPEVGTTYMLLSGKSNDKCVNPLDVAGTVVACNHQDTLLQVSWDDRLRTFFAKQSPMCFDARDMAKPIRPCIALTPSQIFYAEPQKRMFVSLEPANRNLCIVTAVGKIHMLAWCDAKGKRLG